MTIHALREKTPYLRLATFSLLASVLLGGCLGGGGGTDGTDVVGKRKTVVAPSTSGSAALVWTMPTTNTDGSALVDLQGFNVYMGDTAQNLARVASVAGSQTNYTVSSLAAGTHYFAVTAYNAAGAESDFSNIGSKATY
jgi:hypothetical protein